MVIAAGEPWRRGDTLAVIGISITTVGFGFTISQLFRTAGATRATQRAIERTEHRMLYNHLLVLVPQFRLLEGELDSAASDDDKKLAIRTLVAFSHISSEVAGLLRGENSPDQHLIEKLESCGRKASLSKAAVIDRTTTAVKTVTKDFRSELAELTTYLGGLAGRLLVEAGRP